MKRFIVEKRDFRKNAPYFCDLSKIMIDYYHDNAT